MYYVYRRERLDPAELAEKFSPAVATVLAERERYTLSGDRGLVYEEGSLEDLAQKFVHGLTIPPQRVPFMEVREEGLVIGGGELPLADSLRYEPPAPVSIRKRVMNIAGQREPTIDAYHNHPLEKGEIEAFEQALIGALQDFRKR